MEKEMEPDASLGSELFFEEFANIKNKVKFEGRLLDIDASLCEKAISNLKPFDSGGYGNVFLVRPKKTTDMFIVIKQIQCKDDDGKLRYATCEMLAARLMHFGIVPLWAWAEDTATKTYYLVFPFMENRSLFENLHRDKTAIDNNQKGDLILHKARRLRILYHVACALVFLHKEIPNFRSSYVHRDVTTRNIVLDSAFNARLLDFGLAREYTPGKAGATLKTSDLAGARGYFQTYMTKHLVVGTDLYNLGIVILEVLSSYPPIYSYHKELRKTLKDGYFLEDYDKHIKIVWGDYTIKDKAAIQNTTLSCLINLATNCHDETDTVTSADIKKQLEKQIRDSDVWKDPQPDQPEKRCVICLVNVVSPDAQSILDHADRCKLHVCAACLRNSYLNPIECHTCGEEVQPSIGHQWAAVLVAGNDVNNKDTADAFVRDLNKVYKAITSRHPMTMGLSKETVHRVYPDEPGTSMPLLPKLEEKFNRVSKKTIHSLLFYFTGHHGHNNGFILGANDEYLTIKDLKTCIENAVKNSGGKRVIVLLDCCEAPVMELKLSCSYYQINSCSMKQNTNFPEGEGSLMTEFLVQSLKGQSSRDPCLLQQKTNRPCDICPEFRSNNGFIKVDQLHENMEKHINRYDNYVGNEKHELKHYFSGSCWRDAVIAYFIDNLCTFNFSLLHGESSSVIHEVKQLPEVKKDLDEILYAAYREQFNLPKLKPTDFAEMLAITFRTGPRQCNRHELKTVEMIEAAWNGKRKLCVSLREIENLHLGKVGIFMESEGSSTVMECLQSYPKCQRYQEILTEVVTTSLEKNGARDLWRYVKERADKAEVGSILCCLEEHLKDIKANAKIQDKGTLVFTCPLKDEDGKTITSFFSIHVQNGSSEDKEEGDIHDHNDDDDDGTLDVKPDNKIEEEMNADDECDEEEDDDSSSEMTSTSTATAVNVQEPAVRAPKGKAKTEKGKDKKKTPKKTKTKPKKSKTTAEDNDDDDVVDDNEAEEGEVEAKHEEENDDDKAESEEEASEADSEEEEDPPKKKARKTPKAKPKEKKPKEKPATKLKKAAPKKNATPVKKKSIDQARVDPKLQQYRESCDFMKAPNEDLVKHIQGEILAQVEKETHNDVAILPGQLQDIWMKNDDQECPPSRILLACKTAQGLSHVKSLFIYNPDKFMLEEIWRLVKGSLPNLQKLVMFNCGISVDRVQEIVRKSSRDLQALGLYYFSIGNVDFSRLGQDNLKHIIVAPKKSLGLYGVRLTHAQMGFLCRHLSTRSFTELHLGFLYCTEHGTSGECQSLDLTASRDINSLKLDMLPLRNFAFHPERLVSCIIADLPETVAADAIRCLRKAEQLETFWCGDNAASALVELGRTLPSLINLRRIYLYIADLRGHEQLLVSDQRKLEYIFLGSVTLTAEHLRGLLASLPPHSMEVYLGDSDFGTVTITGDDRNVLQEIRDDPDIDVIHDDVKREGDTCIANKFLFYTKK